MKQLQTVAFGLLVPVLLALSPAEDELAFHPAEGSVLKKTFDFTFDFAVDSVQMLVNDVDMGPAMAAEMPAVEVASTTVVSDTYDKMGTGRPMELTRIFEELSWSYDAGENSGSESKEELEGVSVRFTWDEDEEAYTVTVLDESTELEPEILNSLGEDMDLRSILPGREVAEGDTWELEASAVWGVLMPGFDVSKSMSSAEIPPEAQPIMDFIGEQIERMGESFTFTCEYQGTRDADGKEVGVIGLTLECALAVDLVPMIQDLLAANEVPIEPEIDYADVEFELSGTGEVLWNLAGGHVHTFGVDSDVSIYVDAKASADAGQGPQTTEMSLELSGSMGWAGATE